MSRMTRAPVFPYRKSYHNAGSAVTVQYQSLDDNLDLVELAALEYRIDNLTDATVVLDWTSVDDPAARGSITIPHTLNGMTKRYRETELRQVTFRMTDTEGNVTKQPSYYELGALYEGRTT